MWAQLAVQAVGIGLGCLATLVLAVITSRQETRS